LHDRTQALITYNIDQIGNIRVAEKADEKAFSAREKTAGKKTGAGRPAPVFFLLIVLMFISSLRLSLPAF